MRTLVFTVPLFFVLSENTFSISDSVQTEKHEINLTRLAFVSGTAATFIVAGHIQNYDAWWKGDDKVHFHTGDADGRKVLHADKLGHNYFSFVMSDVVSHSFIWSGVERKNSFFYGGSIALLFQLYVEVEDGTHPELGFSVGDAIADVTGSYFPLMQNEYPFLKNITWKYSVIKTGNVGPIHKTVIDDYESQYFWLSAKLPQMIFGSENFFSKFFNIAIGYSVKNIYVQNKHSEIYLALDYDFEAIPLEGSFVNSVKHVLNYFHFPSPMIRITPSFVGYGFRW